MTCSAHCADSIRSLVARNFNKTDWPVEIDICSLPTLLQQAFVCLIYWMAELVLEDCCHRSPGRDLQNAKPLLIHAYSDAGSTVAGYIAYLGEAGQGTVLFAECFRFKATSSKALERRALSRLVGSLHEELLALRRLANLKIVHLAGSRHGIADGLSRTFDHSLCQGAVREQSKQSSPQFASKSTFTPSSPTIIVGLCHYGIQPSPGGIQPSYSGIQPFHIGIQPSHIGIQPSHNGIQLSNIGIQPSHIGIQPSHIGIQPSNIGIQPSQIGIQPSSIGIQPSSIGIQPSHIGIQPSHNGIQLSNIGIQPSQIGIQLSHIGIQPPLNGV
ncbi:hypothetical protein Pmar_PMAR009752 [Perkinsus marinus ATCC 50983]|uniref:Uncharacterized protein n=1 Tax=Perkinsus marinus (strain ATCC 50983 / TXsc) TaxID=423536 RepID=C5KZF8_PERM5|nr:hypothetical protein Pmar_PMAR009752 [Perkinsus marinus ATCC 50983]EER10118.1 hypothetical protein Pmar_PMAR009752 [Perkinsus marinus ATCC 50983]|eukprot:XP_002778323.1 hypothetical protein Pmar_PMAR009752 [Perkinsus marinus ATCC 50983]